jgi:sucrose-6-phosphate hydrolase SacC (GH32 family)
VGHSPEQATFEHGALHELDAGFEFYAPQTTLSADGRRLLVGWMGVPDGEEMRQPTVAQGWIHQMTCVRELSTVTVSCINSRSGNCRRCAKMSAVLQGVWMTHR